MIGRKTLKSERARQHNIDVFFERVAKVIILSYALFAGVAWLSYRPQFQVASVVVDGIHAVDQEGVRAAVVEPLSWRILSHINRNNMFFYPRAHVLRELYALDTRVASVNLAFVGRQELHVTLQEFSPALLYCTQQEINSANQVNSSSTSSLFGDCFFADVRGYIYAPAPIWSGYPYLTIIASTTALSHQSPIGNFAFEESEYARIQEFLAALKEVDVYPQRITILGENDYRLSASQPWDILWSSKKNPKDSADNLSLVLRSLKAESTEEKEIQFIDLRFGNKIFYK